MTKQFDWQLERVRGIVENWNAVGHCWTHFDAQAQLEIWRIVCTFPVQAVRFQYKQQVVDTWGGSCGLVQCRTQYVQLTLVEMSVLTATAAVTRWFLHQYGKGCVWNACNVPTLGLVQFEDEIATSYLSAMGSLMSRLGTSLKFRYNERTLSANQCPKPLQSCMDVNIGDDLPTCNILSTRVSLRRAEVRWLSSMAGRHGSDLDLSKALH